MNSIRPLVTITILVVVGAFLYVKINEAPVRPSSDATDAGPNQAPYGVPPLAATSATAPQSNSHSHSHSAAPSWSPNPPAAASASTTATAAATDTGAPPPPAVPPVPEIPDMPPPTQPPAPTATSIPPLPAELPANIPTARYPDEPAPNGGVTSVDVAASAMPPTTTPNTPSTPTPAGVETPSTPEQANSVDIAANNLSSPPLAAQENPLRQSPNPTASDPYAAGANPAAPVKVETPAAALQPSFATSWPGIQATLDRGEYATAHQILSRWYNDPTLTPTDAEMVESLLSQLAGTVVYSTEHQLEPAYVAKPGDTLETIAREYNVPWQLLAKINGIAAADQVQPGQELKVVRGPFSAVVDLGREQLTLMVSDRYAGKFPITVPSLAAVSEGQWLVDQKLMAPSAAVVQSAYTPATASVDRAIVLRSEPGPGQTTSGATLTIASSGASASSTSGAAAIRVSPQDAEELSDILSIGSRVVIQR